VHKRLILPSQSSDQKAEKEKEEKTNDLKIARGEIQPSFTVIGSLRW
jgi:hypothetical protein